MNTTLFIVCSTAHKQRLLAMPVCKLFTLLHVVILLGAPVLAKDVTVHGGMQLFFVFTGTHKTSLHATPAVALLLIHSEGHIHMSSCDACTIQYAVQLLLSCT
eukprot:GHRR01021176.1.p2 GENE.GHRR01021176.1~~GHRR01021176.1.p2  ORF type:complete len:103 (-),score=26.90 GHRR01021176.1:558-866(-)